MSTKEKRLSFNTSQSAEFEKCVAGLQREERLLENAIWMLEKGALGDIHPFTVIDTLIRANVRLRNVKQTKAIATDIATAELKLNSFRLYHGRQK